MVRQRRCSKRLLAGRFRTMARRAEEIVLEKASQVVRVPPSNPSNLPKPWIDLLLSSRPRVLLSFCRVLFTLFRNLNWASSFCVTIPYSTVRLLLFAVPSCSLSPYYLWRPAAALRVLYAEGGLLGCRRKTVDRCAVQR